MDKKEVFEKIKEIIFSCPELTYYDLTVEEKELNSIEKIRERISDVISNGESDSTSHLVLGKLHDKKGKKIKKDYVSIESPDVEVFNYTIENQGRLIEKPKKDEFVFIYYYYYSHADYVLTKNENFKNICFKVKEFKNEAVITERDYAGFELTANDASGGGDKGLEIICSDGSTFYGTVDNIEDLIEKFHNYLVEKKGTKPQDGDTNGSLIHFDSGSFTLDDGEYNGNFKYDSDRDGPATREIINLVIKDLVNAFKESAEEFLEKKISIDQKILVIDASSSTRSNNLYELEEWIKIVEDEERPKIDGMFIYLKSEISPNDLNGILLSMENHNFYVNFPNDDNLINQGYWEGEYDTGYFNMDDIEGYIYAHINDDGRYEPKDEADDRMIEITEKYNTALKIFGA